jgi:Zn-dependent protease with chaperone function
MKFKARVVEEGINVSKTHPLAEAGTLVVGLGAMFALTIAAFLMMIEVSLYFVSPEDEAALFADWTLTELNAQATSDPRVRETQALVDRLSQHWPDANYQFRVAIYDSETPNAMAVPGGLIIVTEGLLDQVTSENELAFVLGHELGHFKHRDHLRVLGRGVALSVLMAVASGTDVTGVGLSLADLTLRSFGRTQEAEADRFGLELIHAEYRHINQAWRFFERLVDGGHEIPDRWSYLATHPNPTDRKAALINQAKENRWNTSGELTRLAW